VKRSVVEKQGLIVFIFLFFSLAPLAFAVSGEQYLKDEAAKGVKEVIAGDCQNKDYGYFNAGDGLAVSCQGGSESVGCKKRAVVRKEEYYYVEDPMGVEIRIPWTSVSIGKERAHYLDIESDDFLIIKFLGEMRLIKPERDGDSVRFDVFSWKPGSSFLKDGKGGAISKCCSHVSNAKSGWVNEERETVKDCVDSCGIVFTVGRPAKYESIKSDVIVKEVGFSTAAVKEMRQQAPNSSFTIVTRIKDPSQEIHDDISEKIFHVLGAQSSYSRKRAFLQEVSFKVDASGLALWHGVYHFVPYLYWPKLLSGDGKPVSGKQDVVLKVFQGNSRLDCSAWSPVTSSAIQVGSVGKCDLKSSSGNKEDVIKYRVDAVRGPFYKVKKKLAWGPFKIADFYAMVGDDPLVEIDFSLKFLLSNGKYSDWISSKEELEKLLGKSAVVGQEGGVPEPSASAGTCKPVIHSIHYKGKDLDEPKSFDYASFGDSFSAILMVNEDCSVKDVSFGLWGSSDLEGAPVARIDFFSWEVDLVDMDGLFSKDIVLSEASYPEKLYFAARLVNSDNKVFYSEPVEFHFPPEHQGSSGETNGSGEGNQDNGSAGIAGCDPCLSITGCLACLDEGLASSLFK